MPEIAGLYKLNRGDISKAAVILKDAFQNDPLWNRIFKDEPNREEKLLAFYKVPLLQGLSFGDVYSISENLEGIGVLLPGNKKIYSFWMMLKSGALFTGIKMGRKIGSRLETVFTPIDSDHKRNMAGREHLYIPILGVKMKFQGQGYGGKLLHAFIRRSNMTGLPLYLETETEDNVRFYEKFGFRVLKKIILREIELPLWEMVREPD